MLHLTGGLGKPAWVMVPTVLNEVASQRAPACHGVRVRDYFVSIDSADGVALSEDVKSELIRAFMAT